MKILKTLKEFKYFNFLVAFSLGAIAYFIDQLRIQGFLHWIGIFILGPFMLLSRWISNFVYSEGGFNSYVAFILAEIIWVLFFLYYSFLLHFLFRFIRQKKYKFAVLFIMTYLILHVVLGLLGSPQFF